MFFVPRDVAKKAIKDQLDEIQKRHDKNSAERHKWIYEKYKDY